MMQKRKLSSLLLISFIVVFAFSYSLANEVTFEDKTVLRCDQGFANITVSPSVDIAGFEIVFTVAAGTAAENANPVAVTWNGGLPAGWYTADSSRYEGDVWTFRLFAARLDGGLAAMTAGGDYDIATLSFTTPNVCAGTIVVEGATWESSCCAGPVPISTQFVDVNSDPQTVAVNAGTITIENAPPTLADIPNATIHWGETFEYDLVASDDDMANGCEKLSYSVENGPAGMEVDASGHITWDVPGSAVCDNGVIVQVTDSCGAFQQKSFSICVENDPPAFVACGDPVYDTDDLLICPDESILVGAADTAMFKVKASDPDGGPNPLKYNLVSTDLPNTDYYLNPITGKFTWYTAEAIPGQFVFEVVIEATDSANVCSPCSPENADTATFYIEVVPLKFTIEKVHGVHQGTITPVYIQMPDDTFINYPFGGFDFLIEYDASALTLMGVEPGNFITSCGWEYFTYRTGPFGNCGSGCPTGLIKIVGIAEYNNGPEHPDCFNNEPGFTNIAKINFLVSNDRTLECQYVPIRWSWIDCTDNNVSDTAGTYLFISKRVFDYFGDGGVDGYVEVTDPTQDFPTWFGAPEGCEVSDKVEVLRFIDFYNGGIDIICSKDVDDRGDVNLDGIAYSIADAVMFANYFVYGLDAFADGFEEGSIAATDVNADGLTLTVADLVYLVRVIVGDALPIETGFLKPSVDARLGISNNGAITVPENVQVGAAAITFAGNVTPELLVNMDMTYNFDGVNTKVIVWSQDAQSFTGEFITADSKVLSIEMATSDGTPINAQLVPTEFELSQNYPNPFNPATTIGFALPQASDYSLTIYNVAGQVVTQFTGNSPAGWVEVVWEAGDNASGVYFYRLTAGDHKDTKKMILLK